MTLAGKVALVTGASMGIGEAIAQLLVREGAGVVLTSRDLARAEAACRRIGVPQRTLAVACDVRRRQDINAALQAALGRFGRVDVWVNNAGHGLQDSVAVMDMDHCRALFETNLFGAIECMQAVIPLMKQQGSGTIINISSVAGHIALPYSAAYSASKFAMNAIGKAARMELRGTGVNVLTVCPGFIATDFAENALKGKERMRLNRSGKAGISAERVAAAVLDGYRKGKREVVVPWRDHIGIKFYQLLPRLVERFIVRMLRPADEVMAEARKAREKQGTVS